MHDLSTETLVTKYSLRGVCCEPITAAIALTAISGGISAMGTIAGGKASQQAGVMAQQQKYYEAQQREMQALEARAGAQRSMFEKQREGKLLQSKLQARAAAGGGGADDPTVLDLGGGIAARTEYEAALEMFKGENRAAGLRDEATGLRMTGDAMKWQGDVQKQASKVKAISTIIGSAGTMAYMGSGMKLPSASAGAPLSLHAADYD